MLGFDFDVTGTETVRQTGQAFLKKLRSDDHRDPATQGATPFAIASDIAGLALRYHPGSEVRFLEPCIGSGIFFSALLHDADEQDGAIEIQQAHGVEDDKQFAALAHDLWAPAGLTVHDMDFMHLGPDDLPKASLVMSRPPATPHHHLTSDEKIASADAAEAATGIRPTGLADLYMHFVLTTHKFLGPGAVSAWLIPTEFLHKSAGQAVRAYLAKQVRLHRIHNFDSDALAAADDEEHTSWSVVIFTNETAQPSDTFEFSTGGELFGPDKTIDITYSQLDPDASWQNLSDNVDAIPNESYTIDDFFRIRRGWTAPGEKFFVLDEERAWALGIQPYHMHPMLPPPEYVTEDVIHTDDWDYPITDHQRVVVFSRYDFYRLHDQDPAFLKYMEAANGDTREASEQRGNRPWYNLHLPGPPPILVQPAREEDPAPFRFILNHSRGIAGPEWIEMHPNLSFAQPQLILNGIDWEAVQEALQAIRLPEASKKPKFSPKAVASLDATVIAELLGFTDQMA